MNILGCLDRRPPGIHLDGESVAQMNGDQLAGVRNRKVGFVFQSFNLHQRATALASVDYRSATPAGQTAGRKKPPGPQIGRVGRPHSPQAHRTVGRAAAARASPRADQRPGHPDGDSPPATWIRSGKIMELILRLNKERGTTIIIVTHDPRIAEQTERVIRLYDGQIVQEETS